MMCLISDRLTTLVLDGMASPATYRLWGRKRWDGAREMVIKANEACAWEKPDLSDLLGRDRIANGHENENANGNGHVNGNGLAKKLD